ncbi:MAG: T9SS type A sorting domain-containing protein [Calditrichaceae bacterium]|nr:T9SS type A sorting domain-containing protein [Calditrichaceae bacterium]MBN2707852.1 T9SS type A sorting domain-containing protein [Calditrichaceae bacterium]RQV94918.1 MAG: T9SS C-terminal target domain-containing protein [Calditrichota bacterium]
MKVRFGLHLFSKQQISVKIFLLMAIFILTSNVFAQDQNFYIYLCFGQSNMEGQGAIETQDKTVDSRFKVFQALNCSNLGRSKANWYKAVPPLCQCWSKLSPADYFGRTMAENLPDSITIGVINVSVGGCDIRLFDKDIYRDYDSTYTQSWFLDKVKDYKGNPYQYLIDLARLAQQDGVIKGILLHQGETNTGDDKWPSYVKKIYHDMLNDLSLQADSVPLLAGEVLSAEGNCCSSMNTIINTLPDTIPTAHVISSDSCTGQDNAHFDSEGYREMGRRYGQKMLLLMGIDPTSIKNPAKADNGYILKQNYPNPFNPGTTIRYFLPEKSKVTLEVFDITGRKVKILTDTEASVGEHTINFDGSDLSSGIYFYRLITSNGFMQNKKMLLLK